MSLLDQSGVTKGLDAYNVHVLSVTGAAPGSPMLTNLATGCCTKWDTVSYISGNMAAPMIVDPREQSDFLIFQIFQTWTTCGRKDLEITIVLLIYCKSKNHLETPHVVRFDCVTVFAEFYILGKNTR